MGHHRHQRPRLARPHVHPLPHSTGPWVGVGGGSEGLSPRALDMQSKQQLDKHPGDRQTHAPPSPTTCPTVLRAGPASPSRTRPPASRHTRQPSRSRSLDSCTLPSSGSPWNGVSQTLHRCDTCTHTRVHTPSPLPQVPKLPLVVEKPAPKPRPASQEPGLSAHLPTLSSTGSVLTLTCEPGPTPRSTPGRQVETAQDRAQRSSPRHIRDAKPAFKHRRVQSNDPYSEGGFCH